MDPRIKTPLADLEKQFAVAMQISRAQTQIAQAQHEVAGLRSQIRQRRAQAAGNSALISALDALDRKAESVGGTVSSPVAPGNQPEPPKERTSLTFLASRFAQIAFAVDTGDSAPTVEATKALAEAQTTRAATMAKWTAIVTMDLPAINRRVQ